MKHTPMGYEIINGLIVVNEEEAEKIRTMYAVYLLGASYKAAAKAAGLKLSHTQVKHILQNPRYLGSESYPPIIDEETFQAAEMERIRREAALGRDNKVKKTPVTEKYYMCFSMPDIPRKHYDPVRQAEFAYGLIRNEVSG